MRTRTWPLFLLAAACSSAPNPRPSAEEPKVRPRIGTSDSPEVGPPERALLRRFESDAELEAWIASLRVEQQVQRGMGGGNAVTETASAEAPSQQAAPAEEGEADGGDDRSITNTQEAGVDEGGIVKVHGDHLVVLRRGRLFTIHIGDNSLAPVAKVDVFPPGRRGDAWYDEMLVSDDTIVVIGFSYQESATEIGLFDIDAAGGLRHRSTQYLRSNDYYSSRNYASRLIGDKLVFYMPYAMMNYRYVENEYRMEPSFPSVRRQGANDWDQIISAQQIYRPIQRIDWPFLHTVVTCDLSNPRFACSAQSIVGPYSRNFYVSNEAVYVWVSGGYSDSFVDDPANAAGTELPAGEPTSIVYRLPLVRGEVGALRVWGTPTDQFSFKESRDGYLNVLVRAEGGGEMMWNAEVSAGDLAMLRVRTSEMSSQVLAAPASSYKSLMRPARGYSLQNRFVGDYVLYGTGNSWDYYNPDYDSRVFVYRYGGGEEPHAVELGHGVDRIEVMGQDAVVVGSEGQNLVFSAIDLGVRPERAGRYVQENAMQGETRSHGFFFRSDADGEGVLGLPIRRAGNPGWAQLVEESASVLYLRVQHLDFDRLGELAGRSTSQNDACVVSCVDWYGNARPIFLDGRVFALLGYELVEGRIDGGNITETRRTNFLGARDGMR
jgi:hypothetical protein